jgi:tetratricopeptide (TPR) repeat protein
LPKTEADAATDHDGNRLALVGAQYASYGNYDKGIVLLLAALHKDQLRHPDDTKLALALAYLKAGQKPKAIATFKTVGGTEGAGDIAKLWLLYLHG